MHREYREHLHGTHSVCSFGHTLARLALYNTYDHFYLYDPVKFDFFKKYLDEFIKNKEDVCGGNLP